MYEISFALKSFSIEDTYALKNRLMDELMTKKYVKHVCGVSGFYDPTKHCVMRVDIKPFSQKKLENDLSKIHRITYHIERKK